MRKRVALLLASICLCTACTSTNDKQTTGKQQKEVSVSMQEIYDEIEQTIKMPTMIALNDNYIANYYGIDISLLEEYVFMNAEDVIYADTIILMKVKEESSAKEMKEALETMIEQKKMELENYLPKQFQLVEESEVIVSGSYISLVISEEREEIDKIIEKYIE